MTATKKAPARKVANRSTTPAPRPVVEKIERPAKKAAAKKAAPKKAATPKGPRCVVCKGHDNVEKFTVAGTDERPFCEPCREKLG